MTEQNQVNLIIDFTDEEDLIGLAQGLNFNALTLNQENHSTWIYPGMSYSPFSMVYSNPT